APPGDLAARLGAEDEPLADVDVLIAIGALVDQGGRLHRSVRLEGVGVETNSTAGEYGGYQERGSDDNPATAGHVRVLLGLHMGMGIAYHIHLFPWSLPLSRRSLGMPGYAIHTVDLLSIPHIRL